MLVQVVAGRFVFPRHFSTFAANAQAALDACCLCLSGVAFSKHCRVRQEGPTMRFAVSAKTVAGQSGWVGAKQRDGSRKLVPRQQDAQIFHSHDEAQQVVDALPEIFVAAGVHFTIEPLDTAAKIDSQDPTADGSSGKVSN
jgi:hypothetical protein